MTRSLRRISKTLSAIKHDQQIAHEVGLRGPFQRPLDKAAKKRGWTLVSTETVRFVDNLADYK